MAKKKLTKPTIRAAAKAAARVADALKAEEIEILDMAGLFELSEFFVIATCTSQRQMRAVADEIAAVLKERGLKKIGLEGRDAGGWLLLDYDAVIVHLFLEESRRYYEMEYLWGDAGRVKWT